MRLPDQASDDAGKGAALQPSGTHELDAQNYDLSIHAEKSPALGQHLGPLQFIYNTTRHEATGYTPAYLNHGRELAYPHPEDRRHATRAAPHAIRWRLEDAFEIVKD